MGGYGPHGKDMSFEVFQKAVRYFLCYRESHQIAFCIGGGEPTVHCKFKDIVEYLIPITQYERGVILVTNGKLKKKVKWLVERTADLGNWRLHVSQDRYHEPISKEVLALVNDYEHFSVNDVANHFVVPVGRGTHLREAAKSLICPSDFIHADVNGVIRQCGCRDAPVLGSVSSWCDVKNGCWQGRSQAPTTDWKPASELIVRGYQ
jgi:hypothetical protein